MCVGEMDREGGRETGRHKEGVRERERERERESPTYRQKVVVSVSSIPDNASTGTASNTSILTDLRTVV